MSDLTDEQIEDIEENWVTYGCVLDEACPYTPEQLAEAGWEECQGCGRMYELDHLSESETGEHCNDCDEEEE